MRVLLTGAAGFVGSNLLEYLLKSDQIEAVFALDPMLEGSNIDNIKHLLKHEKLQHEISFYIDNEFSFKTNYVDKFFDGLEQHVFHDILDNFKPDVVLNIGSLSHVDSSNTSPAEFMEYNVKAFVNLLEAIKHTENQPLLIHMSTDEVFGSIDSGSVDFYSNNYNPSSPYSISKTTQEQLLESYRKSFGLNYILIRSTNLFGKNQDNSKLIPKVIDSLLNDKEIPVYDKGQQKRTWLYINDFCEMVMDILTWDLENKTIFIHTTNPNNEITNIQLIKLLGKIVGKEPKIKFVEDRPNHDQRYSLSDSFINKEKTDLIDGLEQTVIEYKIKNVFKKE